MSGYQPRKASSTRMLRTVAQEYRHAVPKGRSAFEGVVGGHRPGWRGTPMRCRRGEIDFFRDRYEKKDGKPRILCKIMGGATQNDVEGLRGVRVVGKTSMKANPKDDQKRDGVVLS